MTPRHQHITPSIILITGPSGAGKSTIADLLLSKKQLPLRRFITCTTRTKRPGERHGKDYWFLTNEQFLEDAKNGFFFEKANVYGHLYGSSRKEMDRLLKGKNNILMVTDVQGAKTVKHNFPETFVIFLDAPASTLMHRLIERKTDPKELKRRIQKIAAEEKLRSLAQIVIVNEDGKLPQTLTTVTKAIKEHLKSQTNTPRHPKAQPSPKSLTKPR